MTLSYENYLEHYGVKGMKWGVRKKDTDSISNKSRDQESARLNSKDRVIAKGTEIQNVSRGQYKDRGERLYTSYTDYDKSEYIALMAGFMYDDRGYVNTFTAKKDIKVPSDQKLVDEFTKLVKENPKQVAKDLSAAEKATKIFTLASENKYSKIMGKVANGDLNKAEKYTNKLVVNMASKKIGKTGDNFQSNLVSQGYDAISDLNDRRGMAKTQDPLIVMDTKNSLGTPVSVKLTKKEISEYINLSIGRNEGGSLREQERKRNDLSNVQHKDDTYGDYLEHFGVKGMKWGVRKDRKKTNQSNNQDVSLEGSEQAKKKLDLKDPRVKKAAVAAAGVTAIVAGAYVLSKGGVSVNSLNRSTVKKGSEKAKDIFEEAKDIIYLSKPHKDAGVTRNGVVRTGLDFVTTGKTKDFFTIFDDAGLNKDEAPPFKKLSNGDVAAIFEDLLGRKDAAGRVIPHLVFIPKEQAVGLNSVEEVIDKFGPRLEQEYSDFLDRKRAGNT